MGAGGEFHFLALGATWARYATGPWERVHLDYGEPREGQVYLVLVDSYSKYVHRRSLDWSHDQGSEYLRVVFRHFGAPRTIVSDNGPQFTSAKFCAEFNMTHLRCAPRMPQSNGHAEKMVHTLKDSLDRAPGALDLAVSAYNYTPNAALGGSTPSEVFFGRKLRTPFDVHRPGKSASQLSDWQKSTKAQFDRHHGSRSRHFCLGEELTVELANGGGNLEVRGRSHGGSPM